MGKLEVWLDDIKNIKLVGLILFLGFNAVCQAQTLDFGTKQQSQQQVEQIKRIFLAVKNKANN